jgi:hypothetical protein
MIVLLTLNAVRPAPCRPMKWGTPSQPAWEFQRARYGQLKGQSAWQVASAFDAGRNYVIDSLLKAKLLEVLVMEEGAVKALGGPVQLYDTKYDPETHRLTFIWERR